jgi:hypothetical protein
MNPLPLRIRALEKLGVPATEAWAAVKDRLDGQGAGTGAPVST